VIGLLARAGDPRALALLALGAVVWMAVRMAPAGYGPLAAALATLTTPVAMGVVFGSGGALLLAALAGAHLALTRGARLASGIALGVACALDHRAWLVVPFLALRDAAARPLLLAGCGLGYAALVAPTAALGLPEFLLALAPNEGFAPGVGLSNLALYLGWSGSRIWVLLLLLGSVAASALLARATPQGPGGALIGSAAVLCVAGALTQGGTFEDLGPALALGCLGALMACASNSERHRPPWGTAEGPESRQPG